MAANCWLVPRGVEALPGVTAIDSKVAATEEKVIVVDPLIDPEAAFIVEVPALAPEAKPPDVIVATETFDELHATVPVRFWVVPSLNVPVAANC